MSGEVPFQPKEVETTGPFLERNAVVLDLINALEMKYKGIAGRLTTGGGIDKRIADGCAYLKKETPTEDSVGTLLEYLETEKRRLAELGK